MFRLLSAAVHLWMRFKGHQKMKFIAKDFYKSVYTAFLFNENETDPHCTHKYFGTLSHRDLVRVHQECVEFFGDHPPLFPRVTFSREAKFDDGKGGTVRVLTLENPIDKEELFQSLRGKFSQYAKDKYPFNPHVTLPYPIPVISLPFTHYALIAEGVVIASWANPLLGAGEP